MPYTSRALKDARPARRLLLLFGAATESLLRNPVTNVVMGLCLLTTGLLEFMEGAIEGFETVVDAYHGIILFGFVTVLRGMLEILEGAEVFAMAESDLEDGQAGPDSRGPGA